MNPYTWHSDGCDPLYKGEVEDYCLQIEGTSHAKPGTPGKNAVSINPVILIEYDEVMDEGQSLEKADVRQFDNGLNLFPNPFEDQIQLDGVGLEKVSVTTTSGQLIKRLNLSSSGHNHKIDLRDIQSGLYLIVIEKSDGTTELRKVIKK